MGGDDELGKAVDDKQSNGLSEEPQAGSISVKTTGESSCIGWFAGDFVPASHDSISSRRRSTEGRTVDGGEDVLDVSVTYDALPRSPEMPSVGEDVEDKGCAGTIQGFVLL